MTIAANLCIRRATFSCLPALRDRVAPRGSVDSFRSSRRALRPPAIDFATNVERALRDRIIRETKVKLFSRVIAALGHYHRRQRSNMRYQHCHERSEWARLLPIVNICIRTQCTTCCAPVRYMHVHIFFDCLSVQTETSRASGGSVLSSSAIMVCFYIILPLTGHRCKVYFFLRSITLITLATVCT